ADRLATSQCSATPRAPSRRIKHLAKKSLRIPEPQGFIRLYLKHKDLGAVVSGQEQVVSNVSRLIWVESLSATHLPRHMFPAVMPPVQRWNLTQPAVHLDVLAKFDRHRPSFFAEELSAIGYQPSALVWLRADS